MSDDVYQLHLALLRVEREARQYATTADEGDRANLCKALDSLDRTRELIDARRRQA